MVCIIFFFWTSRKMSQLFSISQSQFHFQIVIDFCGQHMHIYFSYRRTMNESKIYQFILICIWPKNRYWPAELFCFVKNKLYIKQLISCKILHCVRPFHSIRSAIRAENSFLERLRSWCNTSTLHRLVSL